MGQHFCHIAQRRRLVTWLADMQSVALRCAPRACGMTAGRTVARHGRTTACGRRPAATGQGENSGARAYVVDREFSTPNFTITHLYRIPPCTYMIYRRGSSPLDV